MVLCNRDCKMASEQPVKKKLRITDDTDRGDTSESDETDFVHKRPDTTNLTSLQLSLPSADCAEDTVDVPVSSLIGGSSGFQSTNMSSDLFRRVPVRQIGMNIQYRPPILSNLSHRFSTHNGIHMANLPNLGTYVPRCSSASSAQYTPNYEFDDRTSQTSAGASYSSESVDCIDFTNSVSYPEQITSACHRNGITSTADHSTLDSVPFSSKFPIDRLPQPFHSDQIQNHCSHFPNSELENNTNHILSTFSSADTESKVENIFSCSQSITPVIENCTQDVTENQISEMVLFQNSLVKQCLCGISEATLRKPFEAQRIRESDGTQRNATLSEWPTSKILQFLSNLQLLFDVYLKQNNKGFICSRILNICSTLVRDEHSLIDQIIELGNIQNKVIDYLTARVLASFFIVAKANIDNSWLETIVSNLSVENDYKKINFSIEIIKRIVEWKDIDIHVLEEEQVNISNHNEPGVSGISNIHTTQNEIERDPNCTKVTLTDHESFDTSPIKCLIIKSLEIKWPQLVKNIELIITHNLSVNSEYCILNFLSLWESIISVKANLSVVDTKPFYAHLEKFVSLLNFNLPFIIWRQLLSLFNEVLCYGSTLALQDLLPEETCSLAHLIVRYVKDFRLLDCLPYRRSRTVNSFIGTSVRSIRTSENENHVDKTLLQKMALLVLKSVAITVKETRSDSSDSSVGSDDYDFNQDMQLIERSIRDVLKKLDAFIKTSLEFHPECAFTKMLIHLFSDQDDYMIESMVCTLDITVGIFYRNSVFPDLIMMLNPIYTFIEFLKIVSHDSDVLLDYLVSNETCFLLYLLRFLKYVRRNWSKFVLSCENLRTDNSGLDATMSVLIRLRLQISRLVSKQLFPYNISPVLRLLETCESLYEGNELS